MLRKTFIGYAHNRNNGKTNNLKSFGAKQSKDLNRITKIGQGHHT